MSIFQEYAITWGGKEYVIAPDRIMGLIEVVEEIITIEELHQVASTGPKRVKLSKAFHAILKYAGHNVTVEEIYNTFFLGGSEIAGIVNGILLLMIPPEHLQSKTPAPKAPKAKPKKKSVKG
jgi:hypothetical protein